MHPVFVHAPPLTHSTFRNTTSPARRPRARPSLHPPRPPPSFQYWHSPRRRRVTPVALDHAPGPQEAFLQCIQCLAVYHVEPEELEGPPRVVACSACLHEWYANEDDLIWGDEQASAALKLATERTQGSNAFVAARGVAKKQQAQNNDGPINVFVGNLSFRATEEDLYRAFSGYGAVLKCELPADSAGIPKGYAFVEMQSRQSGMKAIECLQGTSIVGRDISLSIAKPRTPDAKKATGRTKPRGKNRGGKRAQFEKSDKELSEQPSPN